MLGTAGLPVAFTATIPVPSGAGGRTIAEFQKELRRTFEGLSHMEQARYYMESMPQQWKDANIPPGSMILPGYRFSEYTGELVETDPSKPGTFGGLLPEEVGYFSEIIGSEQGGGWRFELGPEDVLNFMAPALAKPPTSLIGEAAPTMTGDMGRTTETLRKGAGPARAGAAPDWESMFQEQQETLTGLGESFAELQTEMEEWQTRETGREQITSALGSRATAPTGPYGGSYYYGQNPWEAPFGG